MAGLSNSLLQILVPKKRPNPKGTSFTSTFQPSNTDNVLSAPAYRDHLSDLFVDRTTQDARSLLADLVKHDSDISATLHSYMTVARTTPRFFVYDTEGNLDREAYKQFKQLLRSLTQRNDYSTGFLFTKSLMEVADDLRYMIMLRGGVAAELVFNKFLLPQEMRHVDTANLEWFETAPGIYKPQQRPPGASEPIDLDIANFFVKYYRQNPTEIYPYSMFISSINTIASRQQVINDLYRIMQKTGYPRIEASVVEEVLRKNAPVEMQQSEEKMREWLNSRLTEIATTLQTMRPDAAWVHFDAVEAKILNERGPGSALDVTDIIEVLNAQNQAALKTMATVIGRGESGVNTASVEARIFSLSAEALNQPVADLFSEMFTFAMRLLGYEGYVECEFDAVELRPDTELEPQLLIKQTRLHQDLSLGLITDEEFHMRMYNRIRPDEAPELSGTNFIPLDKGAGAAEGVSPNSDPLGRSVTPEGGDSRTARSNEVNNTAGSKFKIVVEG